MSKKGAKIEELFLCLKRGGGLTKNEVHFAVQYTYVLFIGSTGKGPPIHRDTSMPPEILDTVHLYGFYAMQKSMLSVTLAAGIGQQGSVSPTYGRVRRAFVRHFVLGGWGGGGRGLL